MSATRTRAKAEDTAPLPPQTTPLAPANHGMPDHSFTLQAIMELQKSVGEMNANLQTMKGTIDGVKNKVDDLVSWKHMIIGGAAVFGVAITVIVFVVSKASDYITIKAPGANVTIATPVTPPATSAAAPIKK